MAATVRWIDTQVADSEGYRFTPDCPTTLLATCFGVLACELLGALDGLPAARRAALASRITRCQSKQSGLFRDPLHDDAILFRLQKFTPLYVEWQETYFALHALDALAIEPDHPLSFAQPFRDAGVLETWVRTLGFDDFWFTSNYFMFLLSFMVHEEGEQSPTAHRVLDLLDARQDPKTGFWGTQQGASLFNGMAGAFHIFGFYRYLGRPIAHEALAVRSTLALQEPSGLFGHSGGGPCEDVDGVDILVKLKPESSKQERAVDLALERALAALRACRRPDGGYCWTSPQKKTKARKVCYSGLETLVAQSNHSDLWSTWFRPLAIALASQHLKQSPSWPVRYRRLPLLGWHSNTA